MISIAQNEYISKKINFKWGQAVVLLMVFLLLLGVNNAHIYNTSLAPFGIGIVLSLMMVKFNGYVLSVVYVLSCLYPFVWGGVFQGINVMAVLGLLEWLVGRKKLKINKYNILPFVLLSMVGFVVCGIVENYNVLSIFVAVVLGVLFVYSCACFFEATLGRGMNGVVNLDEKVCGGVILIIFSVGLANVNVSIINIGIMFCLLLILLISHYCSSGSTIVCSLLVGVGFALVWSNPIMIAKFACMGLGVVSFKCSWRVLSSVALMLSYVCFDLLFGLGVAYGEIISAGISAVTFILIPTKFLNCLNFFQGNVKVYAVENIFNNTKKEVVKRVQELSAIFDQMNIVYRQMIKGKLPDNDAKSMLKEELVNNVCLKCDNYTRCFGNQHSFMNECFDKLVCVGYSKQKISLIDLPEYFATNCCCVNNVVQYYNNLLSAYVEYNNVLDNIDGGRLLLAEQLSGVSGLLNSLAKEISVGITLDNRYGNLIKDNLNYSGMVCLECLVYDRSATHSKINVIVDKQGFDTNKLLAIVNKCTKCKYKVDSIESVDCDKSISVMLSTSSKYDIVFGSAVVTKSGKIVSGDNYTIIPVGEDKYLISICDGMGSDKSARDISELTIRLIENFYKAGFSNDIILKSINKLLSINEQEKFSTIDLCVLDCRLGSYDFIKLGASVGYIKRASGEVVVVDSSGLPVGVLEDICPHTTHMYVSSMDMIVMVSDGVSDILGEDLISLIKSLDIVNPQELSNKILKEAISRSGGIPNDDMTVLCVRVFEI